MKELEGTWEEIQAHHTELTGQRVRVTVLSEETDAASLLARPPLTARELLKLPLAERDLILAEQAAKAEIFYRTEPELTDFEALDSEELFDEYPIHATRE